MNKLSTAIFALIMAASSVTACFSAESIAVLPEEPSAIVAAAEENTPAFEADENGVIASGKAGCYVSWELTADGVITFSGSSGAVFDWQQNYPWSEYRSEITTVVFSHGITEVPWNVFSGCRNIVNLELSDTVSSIKASAFDGSRIENIVVDENNPFYHAENNNLYTNGMNSFVL